MWFPQRVHHKIAGLRKEIAAEVKAGTNSTVALVSEHHSNWEVRAE
jgi:hypothetical protein